jgi:hypothetical protein
MKNFSKIVLYSSVALFCINMGLPEEKARSEPPDLPEFKLALGADVARLKATVIDGKSQTEAYDLCLYDPNDEKRDNDNGRVIARPKCKAYTVEKSGETTLELKNFKYIEIVEKDGSRTFNPKEPIGEFVKILVSVTEGGAQTGFYVKSDIALGYMYKLNGKPISHRVLLKDIDKIVSIEKYSEHKDQKGQK